MPVVPPSPTGLIHALAALIALISLGITMIAWGLFFKKNEKWKSFAKPSIGPGTGRAFIIYGGMSFPQAIHYSMLLTEIIAVVLIIYDTVKGKSLIPYLVTLAVLIAMHLIWYFQLSWWWQVVGGKFAEWFY